MSPRQNNSSGLPPRAKRRPHTKLRTGCAMCKQRRVKCDEAQPVCKNCARWKTSCCYTPCSQQDSLSPSSNTDISRGYKKTPGRPRNHYYSSQNPVSIPAPFGERQDSAMKSPSNESASQSEQDLSLDLADLELLHHYYTYTCKSFSLDEPIQSMYQTNVPQMGLSYPFVLRLLLALAGQHMRHLGLQNEAYMEQDHYAILAEKHFCSAVPQVKLLISELTKDNCQVAYISSILICLHLLARGPRPGDFLVFSEHASSLWIPLLHGVRSIRLTVNDFGSGWLAPMGKDTMPPNTDVPTVATFNLPRLRWQSPLHELGLFIAANVEPEFREHYSSALHELTQNYHATYGNDEDGSYQGDALQQLVFRWLYMLHDQMVHEMQRKEPHAMIMVGYYAVLLKVPELMGCWFVKGWSHHILIGVYGILEDRYRPWLKWPFESVGLEWIMR